MKEIIAIHQDDGPIRIDTSKIPAVEVQLLSATILKSAQAFYDDPENVRRFNEWLEAREKEASNGAKKERQPGP